jgi:hypothetical protein
MPDDRRVLDGVTKLIVDGTNVLYALRRSPAPLPPAALIGRLRAIVPPGVEIVVVLDGSPQHGLVSRQVASGVVVRYAGRWTADEAITDLAEHESAAGRAGLLVVTDDIELANLVRRAGGRTVRNGWLIDRLGRQRLSAPSAGRVGAHGAPADGHGSPRSTPGIGAAPGGRGAPGRGYSAGGGAAADRDAEADADGSRWSPGRGATRKTGNGRRRPSTGR